MQGFYSAIARQKRISGVAISGSACTVPGQDFTIVLIHRVDAKSENYCG